jgi:adhesin HecA-like repeat protein
MQNAASDAKTLGLTLGQAPSAQQLASLKQDIVWMVSTTVNGQSVLVPQVFLAPATIASIQSGAVIASSNINLKLDALNNTGGTISGSKNLDISSKGDITNIRHHQRWQCQSGIHQWQHHQPDADTG